MAKSKGIGPSLPVIFHNAFKEHFPTGRHRLLVNLPGFGGPAGNAVVIASNGDYVSALIAALPAAGGMIIIPEGVTAIINATHIATMSKPVTIMGFDSPQGESGGDGASKIQAQGSVAAGMFQWPTSGSVYWPLTLIGLTFICDTATSNWFLAKTNNNQRTCLYAERLTFPDARFAGLIEVRNYCMGLIFRDISFSGWIYGLRAIYNNQIAPWLFEDVLIHLSGAATRQGVYISTNNDQRVLMNSCLVRGAGANAAQAAFEATNTYITFDNCLAEDCTGPGFCTGASASVDRRKPTFKNCVALRCKREGYKIVGDGANDASAILHGCRAIDCSRTNANTYDGFMLAHCSRVQMVGCEGYKSVYAEQKYGFELTTTASDNEIRGGRWAPNQTGAWLDSGVDNIIKARRD